MIIVGAGMAGLLAANMLARHKPTVLEIQPALPHNHSAVLRFRSALVGEVLGVPFRRVSMMKAVVPWANPVSDALSYSHKCTGQYLTDRSVTRGLVVEERYIAPRDLIEQMAVGVNIEYQRVFDDSVRARPVISTLPMPVLMQLLNYPHIPEFHYVSGLNIKATVKGADAYCSLLIPDPEMPVSRISLTGNELIVEMPRVQDAVPDIMRWVTGLLGLAFKDIDNITVYQQHYSKIVPIENDARKRFIAWATDKHDIYSLGRYATWRPGLLLDDLVKDIRMIESWLGDSYAVRQARGIR